MKITGPGRVTPKSVKKTESSKSGDGAAFASALSGGGSADQVSNVGGTGPLATVDALLSLQEVPDATEGRSKGLARANDMLDLLDEVRKGLLLGAIPVSNLKSLAELARNQKGRLGDSKLEEVLSDIELRAEVELAKLGF
jgi:hypothetical protein